MTFEKFLSNAFEKRALRNPHYSLRAFARDVGVTSSNLSKALKGNRGFSTKTLTTLSRKLGLNSEETELLHTLCESKFARSKKNKLAASEKLKKALIYRVRLSNEKISLISDWYHLAILALMQTKEFKSEIPWIADRLLIHEKVVRSAVERLFSLGLIEDNAGNWTAIDNLFVDSKGVPSAAIREYHHQILKKADSAIDTQGLDDREFASIIFAFDKCRIDEAKADLKKFREDFGLKYANGPTNANSEIYSLGLQLFQISKLKKEKTNRSIL